MLFRAILLGLVLAAAGAAAAPARQFFSPDGHVRVTYPAALSPRHDFAGRALMNAGWRLVWDGAPVGRGRGVVCFELAARPVDGMGRVTEMVQIGMSRDPAVVATCGTAGTAGGSGARLPNRMLGGHRWTAYSNGDAGMSQEVSAIDLRTVVGGICYSVDRVSYAVKAVDPLPRAAPSQAVAAARMDAILASIRIAR